MRAPAAMVGVARTRSADAQIAKDAVRWWVLFAVLMGFVVVTGAMAFRSAPDPFSLALAVLILALVAAFLRPTIGVYLIVFLTLIGDGVTTAWWPFAKNLSSRESILFVHDSLAVNPLEILLIVTITAWLLRYLEDPVWTFWRGRLFNPVMVFAVFVILGGLRGIAAGGDRRIAIFEARPLMYIPVVYILITNLLVTRAQYRRLVMMAFAAISIQSIFALWYYRGLPEEERQALETLSEHSATIHMNAMFVFLLAAYLFKCSTRTRAFATVLIIPVFYAYFLSQRRAAMIALFIGLVVLAAVLFHRRRRAFWFFVPLTALIGLGYLAATWNTVGPAGLPSQAVKTVLFPDQLGEADRSSDLYRKTEAFDLWFTIQQNRLLGVGFGKKFLQPVKLPDISFFEFWEYLPHNSILWVWLKTGFFGLISMFVMFGRAIQTGARSALVVRTSEHAAIVVVGLTYAIMFLVFAYVDIAWGSRSTVFLAVAFALCADFAPAVDAARDEAPPLHRYVRMPA